MALETDVLLPTLLNIVKNIAGNAQQYGIIPTLNKCGQQNIVQCCFHEPQTGCSFHGVHPKDCTSIVLMIRV